jgi:hypothetical protein
MDDCAIHMLFSKLNKESPNNRRRGMLFSIIACCDTRKVILTFDYKMHDKKMIPYDNNPFRVYVVPVRATSLQDLDDITNTKIFATALYTSDTCYGFTTSLLNTTNEQPLVVKLEYSRKNKRPYAKAPFQGKNGGNLDTELRIEFLNININPNFPEQFDAQVTGTHNKLLLKCPVYISPLTRETVVIMIKTLYMKRMVNRVGTSVSSAVTRINEALGVRFNTHSS